MSSLVARSGQVDTQAVNTSACAWDEQAKLKSDIWAASYGATNYRQHFSNPIRPTVSSGGTYE